MDLLCIFVVVVVVVGAGVLLYFSLHFLRSMLLCPFTVPKLGCRAHQFWLILSQIGSFNSQR